MALNALQSSSVNEDNDQDCWYNIIWLDQNVDTHSNLLRLKYLRDIDPGVKSFTCRKECIIYIQEQNDRRKMSHIIFIISGSLSETTIPEIQDYSCIFAIFIFCTKSNKYEHLKYPKLRAICTETDELLNSIEMCISKYTVTTDFSIFHSQQSTSSEPETPTDNLQVEYSIRNLKEDQARFLWYRQMHEFMIALENNDDEEAKEELINHFREQCTGKVKMLQRIDEFNNQSSNDNKKKAISWYTDTSFIHQCTNSVLRKENIAQIYSYRYIIKLICQQLKELHKPFINNYREKERKTTLRLYRGQHLKLELIQFLQKNIKNLISLNGFVSTTKDRNIAIEFINNRLQEGFEPVLFKIDVDMTEEHSIAFADVSESSKYPEEQEVLLSIGSIFRVQSVDLKNLDDQRKVYEICLSLNQRNQLTVTDYIKQTYATSVDSIHRSVLFGKLLFDMGECEAAIKYFSNALNRLTIYDKQLRAIYLNNIGACYNEKREKKNALEYYLAAFDIYTSTKNKEGMSTCQHNIASIYHADGDHQEALSWASEALKIRCENDIEKASTFNLLGCIYLALQHFDAALAHFEDALKLRSKYLGRINKYHPDIGVSYHNLGKVYLKTNYYEARSNFLRAAEIYRHNYPQSNPLVQEIDKCLTRIH